MQYAACLLYFDTETNKVLSVTRKNNLKSFGLPGGKVEDNETILDGLLREVLEETGYILDPSLLEQIFHKTEVEHEVSTYVYKGKLDTSNLPMINEEDCLVSLVPTSVLTNSKTCNFSEYNLDLILDYFLGIDIVEL